MRIAIDYRVLSSTAWNRGMGRYTQQQLREVLKIDRDNEYLLVGDKNLQRSRIFPEILSARNVSVVIPSLPILQEGANPDQQENVLRFAAQYQDWLYKQRVDLYHATTPFLPGIVPHFDACPFVATLYDLIPLVFARQYGLLPDTHDGAIYIRSLHFLLDAERIIAISDSARQDAQTYLGFPQERIDLAYPIIESCFRRLDESEIVSRLERLNFHTIVPGDFLLTVTGIHHSKNLETLLRSYALLPQSLRRQLPLVIVLPGSHALETFTARYGRPEHIVLLESVSDEELAGLYNAATICVQISRYEGFGFPVAEAMRCGAPVITSTTSSLPEVGGDVALLVDPNSAQSVAMAIEDLFGDRDRRKAMRDLGPRHAAKFNGEQLGQHTYRSYHDAIIPQGIGCPVSIAPRRHIAIWSSFPPLKCGVADYTAELVEQLATIADVEVFVDDGYLPDQSLVSQYHVQHYTAFERRHKQHPFDAIVYQMGSTYYQEFMYEALRRWPGIVVLHDLVMGLGLFVIHQSRKQMGTFRRILLKPEGRQVSERFERILALPAEQHLSALGELFEEHLLLQWVMDHSLSQIVHMEAARDDLSARYRNSNVHVVQMGVRDPWDTAVPNVALAKARLGIDRSMFLVGVFGIVDPVKRVEVTIRAFAEVLKAHPNSTLVIVGNRHDSRYAGQLDGLVAEYGLQQRVLTLGHLGREDFDRWLLACDAIVNLRYPSRKGMSAILVRAIAAGKPTIITDLPEWEDFPSEFCWRVAPDEREIATVAAYLCRLAEDPALRQAVGAKARAYFARFATTGAMASQYLRVIEQTIGSVPASHLEELSARLVGQTHE